MILPPASNGWPISASSTRSVTCSTTISTNSMNVSAMPPLRTPCAMSFARALTTASCCRPAASRPAAAKCIKFSRRLRMRLFAVCGTGSRRAWRRRSRARRLPARRRRCLSSTTRKRRSMGCCLPRMKKRRWRGCARFCQQPAAEYEGQRDFPAVEGTSRLSPCLATGVLSPRQCLHRLLTEHPAALDGGAGATGLMS